MSERNGEEVGREREREQEEEKEERRRRSRRKVVLNPASPKPEADEGLANHPPTAAAGTS
jgi:hypothetical protein